MPISFKWINELQFVLNICINLSVMRFNLNKLFQASQYIFAYLMEQEVIKYEEKHIQIQGKNFHAFIAMTKDTLSLDIAQFKKGKIYASTITNFDLEKETRRFLIFKRVNELFSELSQNKKMEISDENSLLVPLQITYKNKNFELKIQLPLVQTKFTNEADRTLNLFEKIQKISGAKVEVQKRFSTVVQHIDFKGDRTNLNYKSFKVSNNEKTIEMVGDNKENIFNHFQKLPKQGTYLFEVKILKSKSMLIIVGICGDNIKSGLGSNALRNPFFLGLYLNNGDLYQNGKSLNAIEGLKVSEGQIVKVKINMNKHSISWFLLKESRRYETQINKELINVNIHPMVMLYYKGDILEFIN